MKKERKMKYNKILNIIIKIILRKKKKKMITSNHVKN